MYVVYEDGDFYRLAGVTGDYELDKYHHYDYTAFDIDEDELLTLQDFLKQYRVDDYTWLKVPQVKKILGMFCKYHMLPTSAQLEKDLEELRQQNKQLMDMVTGLQNDLIKWSTTLVELNDKVAELQKPTDDQIVERFLNIKEDDALKVTEEYVRQLARKDYFTVTGKEADPDAFPWEATYRTMYKLPMDHLKYENDE